MKSISIYRLNAILLLFILFTIVLYFGKVFLVPLFFAILFGMLLLPVCNKFEQWGIGRIGSSLLGILIIVLFIAALFGIIIAQGTSMADDLPQMQAQLEQMLQQFHAYIETEFNVAPPEQMNYLRNGIKKMSESGSGMLTSFLSGIMGILTSFILVILYFFFLMWKREKYEAFFLKLVNDENRLEVQKELQEITQVASQYLVGRLISMGFLAAFYMIGFSIVGLQNGLLVALVAVIPTIVPYVGAFVGSLFPLALALICGDTGVILPVIIILVIAQVIDNNIIEPLVEGESLSISPIFTIVAIVLGELLWGVAGMILFLPLFAILKIVCDHVPSLHPYSFLLENESEESKWLEKFKGWFGKK